MTAVFLAALIAGCAGSTSSTQPTATPDGYGGGMANSKAAEPSEKGPPGIAKQTRTFASGQIRIPPGDLLVTNTGQARFTIDVNGPTNHLSFQWYFNGQPISGATGMAHVIPSATTNHIGLYTCRVTFDEPGMNDNPNRPFRQPQSEVSEPGTLSLYWEGSLIVCGAPILGSGGAGTSCPGPYVGYVNFKTATGGGFTPLGTTFSARDPQSTSANPTAIRWFDSQVPSRSQCSGGGAITSTAASTARTYKFTVYLPVSNYLTNTSYQLTLEGFRAP